MELLQIGSSGKAVRQLQRELTKLGFHSGARQMAISGRRRKLR